VAKSKRPNAAEEELLRREQATREDLSSFVDSVVAIADDIASDARLDDKERALVQRHRGHFSRSVADLVRLLDSHSYSHEREFWLFSLWQALGSTTLIANRWTERIELGARIEHTARATAAKQAASAIIDDVLVAAATPIWRRHKDWAAYTVAGEMIRKQLLTRLPKAKQLKQDAISKRLTRLRHRILPS
jgi:hypothetical protein